MNRFSCLDSSEKNSRGNVRYSNEFQAMLDGLDDEDGLEDYSCSNGKKKRLRIDQVQALEKIFEVDNKLDPERKLKLAQELGLQPRQVAIWFQNRRARWKTKQLERDYHLLKANYEALQHNYSKVEQEKEGLVAELRGLKGKLGEENTEINHSIEKVATLEISPEMVSEKCNDSSEFGQTQANHEVYTHLHLSSETKRILDLREGLSDSDSSGVLNEDTNNLMINVQQPFVSKLNSYPATTTFNGLDQYANFSVSAAPVYHPHLLDSRVKDYQHQFLKMEEENHHFGNADDQSAGNFFSVDQAPFYWYLSDPRNQ